MTLAEIFLTPFLFFPAWMKGRRGAWVLLVRSHEEEEQQRPEEAEGVAGFLGGYSRLHIV